MSLAPFFPYRVSTNFILLEFLDNVNQFRRDGGSIRGEGKDDCALGRGAGHIVECEGTRDAAERGGRIGERIADGCRIGGACVLNRELIHIAGMPAASKDGEAAMDTPEP